MASHQIEDEIVGFEFGLVMKVTVLTTRQDGLKVVWIAFWDLFDGDVLKVKWQSCCEMMLKHFWQQMSVGLMKMLGG